MNESCAANDQQQTTTQKQNDFFQKFFQNVNNKHSNQPELKVVSSKKSRPKQTLILDFFKINPNLIDLKHQQQQDEILLFKQKIENKRDQIKSNNNDVQPRKKVKHCKRKPLHKDVIEVSDEEEKLLENEKCQFDVSVLRVFDEEEEKETPSENDCNDEGGVDDIENDDDLLYSSDDDDDDDHDEMKDFIHDSDSDSDHSHSDSDHSQSICFSSDDEHLSSELLLNLSSSSKKKQQLNKTSSKQQSKIYNRIQIEKDKKDLEYLICKYYKGNEYEEKEMKKRKEQEENGNKDDCSKDCSKENDSKE